MTQRVRTSVFVLAAACALAAAPGSGFAQETESPMIGGAWALQFRISENFTLSTFKGSVVSLKRHYSPSTAIRLGVSVSALTRDDALSTTYPDTTVDYDRDTDNTYGKLDLQYLHYTNPGSGVSLYLGTGPFVQYGKSTETEAGPDNRRVRTQKTWSAGATGVLGAEWSLSSVVGIHAEYGVSAGYTHNTYSDERESPDYSGSQKGHTWSVAGSSVLFGLSVYF